MLFLLILLQILDFFSLLRTRKKNYKLQAQKPLTNIESHNSDTNALSGGPQIQQD